jgi:hypothetical protein
MEFWVEVQLNSNLESVLTKSNDDSKESNHKKEPSIISLSLLRLLFENDLFLYLNLRIPKTNCPLMFDQQMVVKNKV